MGKIVWACVTQVNDDGVIHAVYVYEIAFGNYRGALAECRNGNEKSEGQDY